MSRMKIDFNLWKHSTKRRQKSYEDYWPCKLQRSIGRMVHICLSISRLSTEPRTTPTFRWLITDNRTEMPCVTLKWLSPCTKKASNSFRTITVTIIWVWSSTALDGRTRAFCWTVVYKQTTRHSLTNGSVILPHNSTYYDCTAIGGELCTDESNRSRGWNAE